MTLRATRRSRPTIESFEPRLLMDVTFNIDTTTGRQAISPYIYGTNYNQLSAFTGYTFSRVGGNRWTAYNWANNASNAGSDWYYSNDGYLGGGNTPGGAVASIIVDVGNHNAPLLLTVPVAGYVSADKNGNVDITDPNRFTTRFVPTVARKGSPFTLNPSPTGTIYQDEFVNWVKQTYPATQTNPNRPVWYSIDNEPDLWSATHEEIHPAKVTYAELIQKTIDHASAIKDVSSISLVFGPVNYGWAGMMTLQDAPDRSIAGGLNFQQYYLQQIRNAEIAAGRKLVDVDDIHYYSEARDTNNHRVTEDYIDAPAVAARVQSARSLYDPTYVETSWITQYSTGGQAINLIPRFQGYINAYNPGTKLAITEYNFGGANHISGAIAQAEALGAFGRGGVFAANYWQLASSTSYHASAFNMFRNFDGAGAKFGDTATSAMTTDMNQSAIFSSVDTSDPNRIVLIAINRTGSPLTSHFNLNASAPVTAGQWYALTGASSAIQNQGNITISGGSFDLNLPAYSVNTITLTVTPSNAVAMPTFSPAAGTYNSPKSVMISTSTAGALIRYTTDGTTPTSTTGVLYTGPVPISTTTTFKAIAYKPGMDNSAVRTAVYTIAAAAGLDIYTDALATDWSNWSWTSTIDLASTATVQNGTRSIAVTATGGWSALSLRKGTAIDAAGYTAIKFWVHGGTGSNKSLRLYTQAEDNSTGTSNYNFTAVANTWTEITVPLSSLGNPALIERINFQNGTDSAQSIIYFDSIRLVSVPANLTPGDVTLSATAIAENRPAGTAVGTLSTYDPDLLDTFTYTLVTGAGSTDNASFAIAGNELRTAASFNFETKASCAIRIRSTDQGGLWTEKPFTITITDIDEVAPTITSTSINGGAAQRSMVKTLSVVFSEPVTLAAGAITVLLSSGLPIPNTAIAVTNPSADGKTWLLTFSGSAILGGSLADGVYDLKVTASAVTDLAGNPLTANHSQRFYRLFGDNNGDRVVNLVDYRPLRTTLGRSTGHALFNSAFDFDDNGAITTLDLSQFRRRFGKRLSY